MNKILLSGNLVKDNDLRLTTNKTPVLQNTIAVRRNIKNDKGEYDSDFINIVIWGQQAEYINKYAPKGSKIELVGRWQHRSYQDNQGNTRYVDECIVEDCSILISKAPQEEQKAVQPTQSQPIPQVVQPVNNNPFTSVPTGYYTDENGNYFYNERGEKEYLAF